MTTPQAAPVIKLTFPQVEVVKAAMARQASVVAEAEAAFIAATSQADHELQMVRKSFGLPAQFAIEDDGTITPLGDEVPAKLVPAPAEAEPEPLNNGPLAPVGVADLTNHAVDTEGVDAPAD